MKLVILQSYVIVYCKVNNTNMGNPRNKIVRPKLIQETEMVILEPTHQVEQMEIAWDFPMGCQQISGLSSRTVDERSVG
jgi:hypothetical protein